MKILFIFLLIILYIPKLRAEDDFYKRFINRAGYSFSEIDAKDKFNRSASTRSQDVFLGAGLQMKISQLWLGHFEVGVRQQRFQDNPNTNSYLLNGHFSLRRKVFHRFDAALVGGLRQQNFLYGSNQRQLSVKKLTLPLLGIQTYTEVFRFITSGISLKLAYLRSFQTESDDVNVKSGNTYRVGAAYLLRYRNIDWSLEYSFEKSNFEGNYKQDESSHSVILGLAYE